MNEQFPDEVKPVEGFNHYDEKIWEQLQSLEPLWAAYIKEPLKKNGTVLSNALTEHAKLVQSALTAYEIESIDEAPEDSFNGMLTYVTDLHQRRVKVLNKLTESDDYPPMKVENVDEMREYVIENEDISAAEIIYNMYKFVLDANVTSIQEDSIEAYGEKPSTIRKERLRMVGAHALDVAKMGAGVVIGIAIAKRSKLF